MWYAEENLEKELPENLKVFYKKFEITALKDKLKIVGSCKKCEKKLQEIGNLLKLRQIFWKAEAECPSIRKFFRKSASVCIDALVMEDAIVKYIILDMRLGWTGRIYLYT